MAVGQTFGARDNVAECARGGVVELPNRVFRVKSRFWEEFIGKVKEAWIPSAVFGGDIKSVGCPYGGGSTYVGGCRHENG